MSYELYRQTKIGESLVEALDELVSEDKLPPEMAMKVLEQFDKSMFETLSERVKSKATIKGSLHTYRFCDNVWTFILEDATVKLTNPSKQTDVLMLDKLKIVCCDGKLLSKEEG